MERKTYTLRALAEAIEDNFTIIPMAKINFHNKKSYDKSTIFATTMLALDVALSVYGDREILYPQLDIYEDNPCIKFGIIVTK